MKVAFSDEAQAQVEDIDAWWREHRRSAPDLFASELGQMIALLEQTATLGTPYDAGKSTVHRLLLRRTHYHLYFVMTEGQLLVVAAWSAFRGRGPRL